MRKQLVCCQLGAEFTLLVGKFAAGTDEENWLSARQASLSTLCTYLLWQKKKTLKTQCTIKCMREWGGVRGGGKKLLESWQNDAADGVKNMERVCDP